MPEPTQTLNEDFWLRLFPDSEYRLPMKVHPGDAKRFWGNSTDAGAVLAERRRWLEEAPQNHFLFSPEAEAATAEAVEWYSSAMGRTFKDAREVTCGLEPDWVLLDGDAARGFPVLGGAVLFPSGWGIEEKLGHPLAHVHGPVPGLAEALGPSIATFLARIQPGAAWERENWGLSAEASLNHHPARHLKRLGESATLGTTLLRLERQYLMRLPRTGAILFGIRVTNHRLDELIAEHPALAARVARALETMPDAMAAYKGLATARDALLRELAGIEGNDGRR